MFQRIFAKSEKGQGLVEYALILVLIAVVVIVVLSQVGSSICGVFASIITPFRGNTLFARELDLYMLE